jgi:hypothetical protein
MLPLEDWRSLGNTWHVVGRKQQHPLHTSPYALTSLQGYAYWYG